eukprot:GHVU01110391.1.p1 GENE.GHVU01110391.1~~GHVU01110391.1.p1  ORF type:complete len:189 (+),score=13.20 GHVU01110391.1:46-612(+)
MVWFETQMTSVVRGQLAASAVILPSAAGPVTQHCFSLSLPSSSSFRLPLPSSFLPTTSSSSLLRPFPQGPLRSIRSVPRSHSLPPSDAPFLSLTRPVGRFQIVDFEVYIIEEHTHPPWAPQKEIGANQRVLSLERTQTDSADRRPGAHKQTHREPMRVCARAASQSFSHSVTHSSIQCLVGTYLAKEA